MPLDLQTGARVGGSLPGMREFRFKRNSSFQSTKTRARISWHILHICDGQVQNHKNLKVVLSDMFVHVTTKFLWHCWTQCFGSVSWATCGVGVLIQRRQEPWNFSPRPKACSNCNLFAMNRSAALRPIFKKYLDTPANLQIIAQLIPFFISWPNPDVQNMIAEALNSSEFPPLSG